MRIHTAACIVALALTSMPVLPAQAAPPEVNNKIRFQFFAFPGTMEVDTLGTMAVCMANEGAAGEITGFDQVLVTLPSGTTADDLVYDAGGLTCTASRAPWRCGVDSVTPDEIVLSFWAEGGAVIAEGETVYFTIGGVPVNGTPGLSFLTVDQEIAANLAAKPVNTTMGVFKATPADADFFENDPTVADHVKDGISWREVQEMPADFADGKVHWGEIGSMPSDLADGGIAWGEVRGIPAGFSDGTDDGLLAETDPTVPPGIKDGISWDEITGIPGGFLDGVDNAGLTSEADPTVVASVKDGVSWTELQDTPVDLADGLVNWSELRDIPAGFQDGVDNLGITQESDPQVGSASTNRIPKWDGRQLVDSNSLHENDNGDVGIGSRSPQAKLHVAGNIIADSPSTDDHVATKAYVDQKAPSARILHSTCYWKKIKNNCESNSASVMTCNIQEVMTGVALQGGEGSCSSLRYMYIRCCHLL